MNTKQLQIIDWITVLLYILLLYLSLPFVPALWENFAAKMGNFADYLAAFVLGLVGLGVVFYLLAKQKGISSFVWLAILASTYAWGLKRLQLSIERVHFIEYGLLSILVFRALRHSIKDKSLYLWSAITAIGLGFLDEWMQYVLPNRVGEMRDVLVNSLAAVLGLVLIGLCLQNEKYRQG